MQIASRNELQIGRKCLAWMNLSLPKNARIDFARNWHGDTLIFHSKFEAMANEDIHTYTISVVTPLANEASTIDDFLSQVCRQLGPRDRIFCVVDNASKDNTRECIENFAAQDDRIVCVWAPENRCVVDAYFRGYREAIGYGSDWILEMDGGLSHQPEEIPNFRSAIESGKYDYVGGSRFMSGGAHSGSIFRNFISRAGTVLSNLVLRTKFTDMTGGFQCFSRKTMQLVIEKGVKSRGHFFQTEIKYLLRNHRWLEIPIVYNSPSASVNRAVIWESIRNLYALAHESKNAE